MEKNLKNYIHTYECVCVCVCVCVTEANCTLLYAQNEHNIVNQLYFNKKDRKK